MSAAEKFTITGRCDPGLPEFAAMELVLIAAADRATAQQPTAEEATA